MLHLVPYETGCLAQCNIDVPKEITRHQLPEVVRLGLMTLWCKCGALIQITVVICLQYNLGYLTVVVCFGSWCNCALMQVLAKQVDLPIQWCTGRLVCGSASWQCSCVGSKLGRLRHSELWQSVPQLLLNAHAQVWPQR